VFKVEDLFIRNNEVKELEEIVNAADKYARDFIREAEEFVNFLNKDWVKIYY
jgi:hypothetical protein